MTLSAQEREELGEVSQLVHVPAERLTLHQSEIEILAKALDELARLQGEVDGLRAAAWSQGDDCFEHASNCCHEWCDGCKHGMRARGLMTQENDGSD